MKLALLRGRVGGVVQFGIVASVLANQLQLELFEQVGFGCFEYFLSKNTYYKCLVLFWFGGYCVHGLGLGWVGVLELKQVC